MSCTYNMKKLIILTLLSFNAHALEWESGPDKSHLIELFTSQSCSSCPPAEAWLNKLKDDPRLFKEIVPVEFHVTYWNHLSWKDPFSSKEYTNRQRKYARLHDSNTVFTPQLLLNAQKNLRSSSRYPERSKQKTANLKVKYQKDKKLVSISWDKELKAYCEGALLGGGYKKKIPRGENSGRTLTHEFVVTELKKAQVKNKKCTLKFSKDYEAKSRYLAIWLRSLDGKTIYQATGSKIE